MPLNRNRVFSVFKWLVTLAVYVFLIYKLANIEYWNEFKSTFVGISAERILLLLLVIVLLPLNWLLEAVKWQKLTGNLSNLSLKTALKSVLAGVSTGYITPNRIGDFAGRIVFLPAEKRVAGVALSLLNSLTQNIVMTVFGLAGAIFYFTRYSESESSVNYLIWIGVAIGLGLLLYFTLPYLLKKVNSEKWTNRMRSVVESISSFTSSELTVIILISVVRYFVFCIQYFILLHFFQIEVPFSQALFAIPAMYLFITFTPSFAATEPAIRGSYAVMVFSAFSENVIGIMLTGIMIWLINFVVPMIAGTVVWSEKKIL